MPYAKYIECKIFGFVCWFDYQNGISKKIFPNNQHRKDQVGFGSTMHKRETPLAAEFFLLFFLCSGFVVVFEQSEQTLLLSVFIYFYWTNVYRIDILIYVYSNYIHNDCWMILTMITARAWYGRAPRFIRRKTTVTTPNGIT